MKQKGKTSLWNETAEKLDKLNCNGSARCAPTMKKPLIVGFQKIETASRIA